MLAGIADSTVTKPPLRPNGGHPHRDARFPSSWERRGRPSAPCALRCRVRWIPAFAGMTGPAQKRRGAPLRPVCTPLSRTLDSSLRWNDGACAGTTGAPLRPVCAPLSRTLDSSLRWNDGACAGTTGRPSAPCALRCRARWIPAFAGMTGPARERRGDHPHPHRVRSAVKRTKGFLSLRWNDGAPYAGASAQGITLILTFSVFTGTTRDLSLRGERRKHPTQRRPHRGQGCEVPVFTGTTGGSAGR